MWYLTRCGAKGGGRVVWGERCSWGDWVDGNWGGHSLRENMEGLHLVGVGGAQGEWWVQLRTLSHWTHPECLLYARCLAECWGDRGKPHCAVTGQVDGGSSWGASKAGRGMHPGRDAPQGLWSLRSRTQKLQAWTRPPSENMHSREKGEVDQG